MQIYASLMMVIPFVPLGFGRKKTLLLCHCQHPAETSERQSTYFLSSEWCDWCRGLFLEMFFSGLTCFRGQELHFVQVRVKASCQTKIPNWRYKWTVDITGIWSVFIRFDSPSCSISSSLSLCLYLWWPQKVELCQTVAAGWPAEA